MAESGWKGNTALGVSVLAFVVAGVSLIWQVTIGVSQSKVNTATVGLSTAQVCLNWTNFVEAQERLGVSDTRIDQIGERVFTLSSSAFNAITKDVVPTPSVSSGLGPGPEPSIDFLQVCGTAETIGVEHH
jgi:hypothetical protein